MIEIEKLQKHIDSTKEQLLKALDHLDYSYNKILSLPISPELDDETLETWESFCVRFSRVADLFLMRFVKAVVRYHDPSFEGSLRDYVNQAQKLNLISDPTQWMKIRELRNITAHEYTDKDFVAFLTRLKNECPSLLSIRDVINRGRF